MAVVDKARFPPIPRFFLRLNFSTLLALPNNRHFAALVPLQPILFEEYSVTDPLVASIPGEEILKSNALAIVTAGWVVVRPVQGRSRVVLSLEALTDIRRIQTTHPGLLVIASGLLLIAAGAYYSKDSSPASIPIGILAFLFLIAYVGTRRASVVFVVDNETIETGLGSVRDASDLVRAVTDAQARILFG
jgi:hypothetical protein